LSEGKKVKRLAPPIEVVTLLDIEGILAKMLRSMEESRPEGIVEPLHPLTVTTKPVVVTPPFKEKLWFGVTIVKEEPVELNIIINTEKSSTSPYTMDVDEKVFDQYFNRPCIKDIMLWTSKDECTVKIRGCR